MRMQSQTTVGAAFFETAIGLCGVAWSERGIVGVHLPEDREGVVRSRLLGRFAGARVATPPASVQVAIDGIVALLAGEGRDLSDVALDMGQVPDFNRRVYEVARTVPPGRTITYGEIAARLGEKRLAREVGQALGQNPFAIVVPCHRVVAAGGKLGGFSASGGAQTKLRMLAIEGATMTPMLPLFDA